MGRAHRHRLPSGRVSGEPACRGRAGRHRRVGHHRTRDGPRTSGSRCRERVRIPRRLDRPCRRSPHRHGGSAGDERGHPRSGQHGIRRYPHAGGHASLRADDRDLPGDHGPPRGRTSLPRAPAPPHDGRGIRVVGLARAHHGGRARRTDRVPRPQGVRAAGEPAVPARHPGQREPCQPRHHRRRRARRGATDRRGSRAGSADRPAVGVDARAPRGRGHAATDGVGVDRDHSGCRTPRRARGVALRQRRHRATPGHRRGRARHRDDRGVRPARRRAVRRRRPGPNRR